MAPGHSQRQLSYPRHPRVPTHSSAHQLSACSHPRGNTNANYHTSYSSNRVQAAETTYHSPFEMPNFSSMSNSDLVDALLIPSSIEQEHEYEHQQHPLSLSNPFQGPQSSLKRVRTSEPVVNGPLRPDEDLVCDKGSGYSDFISDKGPRKQPKRKSVACTVLDEDYMEGNQNRDLDNSEATRKPRRSGRPKKLPAPLNLPSPEADHLPSPPKEVKSKKPPVAKAPKKARPGRLVRKKPIGTAVPKTLKDAGPADRMMWEWKNQGRNWEEIRAEWKRMTGVEPGGSSLSVRYIKLVENLARNGAAGDLELIRFRKEAEDELMSQLWSKVAEKMLAFSSESEYNPKDLQKRYNMIVRSGYNVEDIAEEEKLKCEDEQMAVSPITKAEDLEHDFDLDSDAINAYDNPVANETAAHLREHEPRISESHHAHYMHEELSARHQELSGVFGPSSMLEHEVDGLNENANLYYSKNRMLGHNSMESFVPDATILSGNLFTYNKDLVRNPAIAPSLSLTKSLVYYNSDDE